MRKLRIHYFQHVAFEGPGSIEEWALLSGHSLTSTRFFESTKLPEISDIDWLIIMGGPMSVYDEEQFPWITDEIQFIRRVVDSGKKVIGICLGSQLISIALGAKVYKNKEKEIGWFDIEIIPYEQSDNLFIDMGTRLKVFHWHGDTFDLPGNAIHLACSEGCENQAFIFNGKVLALQFHLETTLNSLQQMVEYGRKELTTGNYVQTAKEILNNVPLIESNREIMFSLLDRLTKRE